MINIKHFHGRRVCPGTSPRRVSTGPAVWGLVGLICLISQVSAQAAPIHIGAARITLLQSSDASTTLRCEFPVQQVVGGAARIDPADVVWQQPGEWVDTGARRFQLPPMASATLAVPTRNMPRAEILDLDWLLEPSDEIGIDDIIDLTGVGLHRGVPLVSIGVRGRTDEGAILKSVTIRLSHPPQTAYRAMLSAKSGRTEPGNPLLLNADLATRLYDAAVPATAVGKAAAAVDDAGAFSLSANWLKLEIDQTGLYAVSGLNMQNAGVSLDQVDPAKIRVFSAFRGEIPSDPELDGAWQPGWDGLQEIAVLLEDGDGAWDAGDVLKFHAIGAQHWLDQIDGTAQPLKHVEHPFANVSTYWLTWEGYGTASPFASAPPRLTRESVTAGARLVDRHMMRLHLEQETFDVYGTLKDNWSWDRFIDGSRKEINFSTDNPVLGDTLVCRIEFRSFQSAALGFNTSLYSGASARLNQDAVETAMTWKLQDEAHADSLNLQLAMVSTGMKAGLNSLYFKRTVENMPMLALDCVDLMYRQKLIKLLRQKTILLPQGTFAVADEVIKLQVTALQDAALDIWDVSDPLAVRVLGAQAQTTPANSYVTGLTGSPQQTRRLVVAAAADYLTPGIGRRTPAAIRRSRTDLDYVVIYGDNMYAAAAQLAQFRSGRVPGIADAQVGLVDAQMLYDAFGGGAKDPLAIRNYLKWLYNSGAGRLKYVCLIGDASRDYRGFLSQADDVLPTYIRTRFPILTNDYQFYPYATDDHLVSFDRPIWHPSVPDPPDLAVGRLTARNSDEALQMVQRIMDYELSLPAGSWRNRVVLAADDLYSPSRPSSAQIDHTEFSEYLSNDLLPPSLDIIKDYLVEFESGSGTYAKFEARLLARKLFNDGLSIFHYIGHGSPEMLADEQLFLDDDVYGLYNGMKRGLFLAFSCDVGIYDGLKPSMAEVFIAQPDGGTIASIAASQVSWIPTNEKLTEAFYSVLYPGQTVQPNSTVSWALMSAKTAIDDFRDTLTAHNAQRYTLLGDPALVLPNPVSGPELVDAGCDSLRGGHLETIHLDLDTIGYTGSGLLNYDLLVQGMRLEKAVSYRVASVTGDKRGVLPYWIPGPTIFRGTGSVDARQVDVSFMVPLQMDYGENARVRLIVNSASESWSMSHNLKAVEATTGTNPDFYGPRIKLAFEDNRYRVKPGTQLQATITDSSGVSILGTNPLNSILLEYDNSGFLTNVSDNFEFDAGRYDQGRLTIGVPENLEFGPHQVALLASDVLGNVGQDTLSFQFVASSAVSINDVTVFPNPTHGDLRLVFELSDPMQIEWTIFTVDGRRIWSHGEEFDSAGPKILFWNGLDARGDVPANGVYLYTLRGRWPDSGGRDLVETGQLIVMR